MRRKIILLTGILMLLLPAATALAGGWVVVTMESLPGQIRAGQPTALSFMVRQHGRTPIHNVSPALMATHVETGQQIQASAEPAKEVGLFVAELTLPEAGAWEWSIRVPEFNHTATFAPLTVLPAETSAGSGQADLADGIGWPVLARWAGLALLVTAAALLTIDRWQGRNATISASGD